MATERARRPEQLRVVRERKPLPHYSFTCPFCPGNEHLAPPEVWRSPGQQGEWLVRVIPNKFSALARGGQPTWNIRGSYRTINAVGIHDVIVETPDHALTTALLDHDQVFRVLRCYLERFRNVISDPRVVHVTIFKNHGADAGTSLEHPHSQLIATPVVSSHVRNRLHEAMRYHDEYGTCVFCDVMHQEISDATRIVDATEHFVALEPFESASPFSTYIYPRRHMASFGESLPVELEDLATVLRNVLAKLYWGLDDPAFNYSIRTSPIENTGVKYYHWYVSIIPRLTRIAGFELGSGMFINTVLPEEAAEFLRKVDVATMEKTAANK